MYDQQSLIHPWCSFSFTFPFSYISPAICVIFTQAPIQPSAIEDGAGDIGLIHRKSVRRENHLGKNAGAREIHQFSCPRIEWPIVPSGMAMPKLSVMVAPITAKVSASISAPGVCIDREYARNGTFSLVWSVPV